MVKKFLLFLCLGSCLGAPAAIKTSLFGSDSDGAFAQAKQEKKILLIDFYGIWCPPCNQMDETVFETSDFLERSKKFVLLKVDADAKESWKLKDRYKVSAYPTYLFTNASGKELYRIVGARSLRTFLGIMDLVQTFKEKDISQACASSDGEDLWRCAVSCSEREDKKCAEKAFTALKEKLAPASPRYLIARTYFVEHASTEDLKPDGYERLMKEFPLGPSALIWATDYLKTFDAGPVKPKKEWVEKVLAGVDKSKADPQLEEFGLLSTDVLEMKANLLQRLGKLDESRAAWREAASALEQLAQSLPPACEARGFGIERISCLNSSGDFAAALELAKKYLDRFPEEFTFYYRVASLLEDQKKYTEAFPFAQKALKYSYGDNKIRSAILMIHLDSALSNKVEAHKIYEEVTKEIRPADNLQVRTHRYLKELNQAYKLSQTQN